MLAKTLEAVGRGRQKLHGRIATDDLGALADDTTTVQHSSDADYLADLAALSDTPAGQPRRHEYDEQRPAAAQAPAPAVPEMPAHEPAYGYAQQPDPYGYQQAYGGQDGYGYPQQTADPYSPTSGYAPAGGAPIQGYDPQQQTYGGQEGYAQPQQPQQPPQAQPQTLDETSLFDTSMISAEQLRAYEQGRGL